MTIFYIFAAAFFVLFTWLIWRNENRLADVSFIQNFVIRVSLLVFGLYSPMFPILLKFTIVGHLVPVVTLLVTSSFCSSVAIVSLVRVVIPSAQLWQCRSIGTLYSHYQFCWQWSALLGLFYRAIFRWQTAEPRGVPNFRCSVRHGDAFFKRSIVG